jgi:hypothetical protein
MSLSFPMDWNSVPLIVMQEWLAASARKGRIRENLLHCYNRPVQVSLLALLMCQLQLQLVALYVKVLGHPAQNPPVPAAFFSSMGRSFRSRETTAVVQSRLR